MATPAGQIQVSSTESIIRQFGVMLALAVSIALGGAVVMWSQTPNYGLLYNSLGDREMSAVISGLEQMNVDYQFEGGAVMVPASDVAELRLKLAGLGLPRGGGMGFELLEKEQGFGGSHSIEKVRIQRALEGEIARSIVTIQRVRSARVLLAIPKQSVFLRHRKKPSASVVVDLFSGRSLKKQEVDAIVHLVSSAVPQLDASQVTVVDQKGALLNSKSSDDAMSLTSNQFEYKKNFENHLINRVEEILLPIVGQGAFQASAAVDLDFTVTEQTQEQFNPDLSALRSEQLSEETNNLSGVQGVPGALSNQPPVTGVAPEELDEAGATGASPASVNTNKREVKNYELNKKISHTRLASGRVKRLTLAVVVDDKRSLAEDGTTQSDSYSDEDIAKFTRLVKDAVGYDELRGDSVMVSNIAFKQPDVPAPLPELAMWEQPWFWGVVKQSLGGLFALILIFVVLKPTIKSLLEKPSLAVVSEGAEGVLVGPDGVPMAQAAGSLSNAGGAGAAQLEQDEELMRLEAPKSYEQRLEMAQKIAGEDPKRVAQVMKTWIQE